MDEHAFKSLSQITRIDTDYEEVAEMIPKPVWCILKSVVKIPLITPATSAFGCAPGKPEATRVKVPPVELDGSRPKEMSGMKPRGRTCKRGIF